jgi:hypothetical protein
MRLVGSASFGIRKGISVAFGCPRRHEAVVRKAD